MAERKKREEAFIELDPEDSTFVLEPAKVEVGSGYAVSVSYDENEKPVVDVKTYGKVDLGKLQREIERIFPNARIRQLYPAVHSVAIAKKEKKRRKKR